MNSEFIKPFCREIRYQIHHATWQKTINEINYSPFIVNLLNAGSYGIFALALNYIESSQAVPAIFRDRMADTIGTTAQAAFNLLVLSPIYYRYNTRLHQNKIRDQVDEKLYLKPGAIAFASNTIYEAVQFYNDVKGKDPGDFAAYAIGALAWIGIHKGAKRLYDSGLTVPIYRVLRIRDERTINTTNRAY